MPTWVLGCLSRQQLENPVVDTKGEGGSQAEEGDLLGLVGWGALDQVGDRYHLTWRAAASAVMEAKNCCGVKFGGFSSGLKEVLANCR